MNEEDLLKLRATERAENSCDWPGYFGYGPPAFDAWWRTYKAPPGPFYHSDYARAGWEAALEQPAAQQPAEQSLREAIDRAILNVSEANFYGRQESAVFKRRVVASVVSETIDLRRFDALAHPPAADNRLREALADAVDALDAMNLKEDQIVAGQAGHLVLRMPMSAIAKAAAATTKGRAFLATEQGDR